MTESWFSDLANSFPYFYHFCAITCSLFMNPNTPAAISAPKIIKRHAKNCREEKSVFISDTLFSVFFTFTLSDPCNLHNTACITFDLFCRNAHWNDREIFKKSLHTCRLTCIAVWKSYLPMQEDTETHAQPQSSQRIRQPSSVHLPREGCTQLGDKKVDTLVL